MNFFGRDTSFHQITFDGETSFQAQLLVVGFRAQRIGRPMKDQALIAGMFQGIDQAIEDHRVPVGELCTVERKVNRPLQ